MEMPDELYADLLLSSEDPAHPFFAGEFKQSEHGDNTVNKYHHDRVLKSKDARIAELESENEAFEFHLKEKMKRILELEAILEARGT